MIIKPLEYDRWIRDRGIPAISSSNKDSPVGLFSSEIFGVTEQEQRDGTAVINLNCIVLRPNVVDIFSRLNRVLVQTVRYGKKVALRGDKLLLVNDTYVEEDGDILGTGPEFIYEHWDRLNYIEKYNVDDFKGKLANNELKRSFSKKEKDSFFTRHKWVQELAYRRETEDSGSKLMNKTNVFYSDLIRYSNILANTSESDVFNRTALVCGIQNIMCEHFEYKAEINLGPHGAFRSKGISRVVDHSGRSTILPVVYSRDTFGTDRIKPTMSGIPIQQLVNEFRDTFVKFSKDFVEALFNGGYFDNTDYDRLVYYDSEFFSDMYDNFKDPDFRLTTFKKINNDNQFTPMTVMIELEDGTAEEKELSNIEFAYIVSEQFIKITENRGIIETR